MTEADILRLIRQAVRTELAPILMGQVTETASPTRMTVQRFASDSPLEGLRSILPYGLASRPPAGMACLVIPLASDSSNQTVAGQFDETRPSVAEGEVALYGPMGQMIWFKNDGSIYQGGGGDATEPIVLGNILAEAVMKLFKAFTDAAVIGVDSIGGPVQLDPGVKSNILQALQKYVTDPSTNFLSQKNFVERA